MKNRKTWHLSIKRSRWYPKHFATQQIPKHSVFYVFGALVRKKNLRTKKIFSRTKDFVVSAPRNGGAHQRFRGFYLGAHQERTKEFWGFAPIAHQRFFRYRTNSAPSKRWLSYGRCAQGRFFLGLWVLLLFKLFKTSFFFLILRFFWMGEDLGSGCFRLVLFSWIIWRYKTERILFGALLVRPPWDSGKMFGALLVRALFGALSNSLVRWPPRTKPRTKKKTLQWTGTLWFWHVGQWAKFAYQTNLG